MGKALIPVWVLFLTACQSAAWQDIHSPFYEIRAGSRLVLHKELMVPEGRSHILLQHGQPARGADEYEVNCRFDVRDLGPQLIHPDTFLITRAGSQREWISEPHTLRFYKEFRLRSDRQPGVLFLTCQDWDYPQLGRPVSLAEIRQALGDYFSFELDPPSPASR